MSYCGDRISTKKTKFLSNPSLMQPSNLLTSRTVQKRNATTRQKHKRYTNKKASAEKEERVMVTRRIKFTFPISFAAH